MNARKISLRTLLFVSAIHVGLVSAQAVDTQKPGQWHASPSEGVLLPRFCWGQMMGTIQGPEYSIPSDACGPFMNHYCLGQLSMVRANRTVGRMDVKKQLLSVAREQTVQTLKDMYPQCPIREHAEKTLIQLDAQLRAFKR